MDKKYFLPVLLLLQILFLQVLKFFPEFVENCYSNGLYVWISRSVRLLFGWVPFSVGDIGYGLLIFFVIRWIARHRKLWKSSKKTYFLKVLSFLSVFYFVFHLLWATNYYRQPLYEKMGISRDYSEKDLIAFTHILIAKSNEIHLRLAGNPDLKIEFQVSKEQIFQGNRNGYKNLAAVYPYFSYSQPSIKKSLISLPLTYMGFSGYLNPFTGEAQVNDMGPVYNFPTTAAHEMAHQMGYASESEANFIGFLASVKNDDLHYQYSGYSFALKYCLSTLERIQEGKSKPFLPLINRGILRDFKESHDFWKAHETFIDTGFEFIYDHYLKANDQKDGMEGYSKFVGLMVNYFKTQKL